MSSDSGSDTSKKWSHQFGLYRQAERTHESFVKMSRRRQRRLGCICVLASIVVIISVIVAILMIYDYALVVESTIHHKNIEKVRNKIGTEILPTNLPDEITFTSSDEVHSTEKMGSSEKLNRRSLDGDHSRIPLLINNLQENGYPNLSFDEYNAVYFDWKHKIMKTNSMNETTHHNQNWRPIKKSRPRPYLSEYKSSTPTPFQKAKMYNKWLENYRNSQRLRNIEQVIKYLQKNISKFPELQAAPSNRHIEFSGAYVHPKYNHGDISQERNEKQKVVPEVLDKHKVINGHAYTFDPLFTYKPENPGDVNLLANKKIRFSPSQIIPLTVKPDGSNNHSPNRNCNGHKCSSEHNINEYSHNNTWQVQNDGQANKELYGAPSLKIIKGQDQINSTKNKLLSVMLDVYPMHENDEELMKIPDHLAESSTKHPMFQFRLRPNKPVTGFGPGSNYYFNSKPKPRPLDQPFYNPYNIKAATYGYNHQNSGRKRFSQKPKVDSKNYNNNPTQMLVHLNLYPRKKNNSQNTNRDVEKKINVQIIKSNSFDYTVNETANHLGNVTDISHFPTVLENARRINELQLLKPQIIMFGPNDATASAVSTEESNYFRRSYKADDADRRRRISTKLKNDYVTTIANTLHSITSHADTISTSIDSLMPLKAENTKNNTRIYKGIKRINQNSKNINDWVSDNIVVTTTEIINVEDFTTNKFVKLYKTIDRNPKFKIVT